MPEILFISYSRKQQDKAIQLDNIRLNQFYWWMDYRIVGTTDWWKNICEAVEESYCLVALMSKTYIESVYCMGELEYALTLNKPVLCLRLEPDVVYPAVLNEKRIQYVDLFDWDVNRVIQIILEAMHRVERDYHEREYHRDMTHRPYLRPRVPTPPTKTASPEDQEIAAQVHNAQNTPPPPVRINEAIIKATQALDHNEFEQVLELLEPVRSHAKDANLETIQELMREARLGQDYARIAALVKSARMKANGCKQYASFRETYPDYPDQARLADLCAPAPRRTRPSVTDLLDLLPGPFAWVEIPGGRGTMKTDESSVTLTIPTQRYAIGKYPVTNAQFAKFVNAGGYRQQQWWTTEGWQKCQEGWHYDNGWKASGKPWTQPRYWTNSQWNGAEQPVVGVSWYEAVAFCQWLTEATGEPVMLPTEAQWQYAAQGDDGREYPWGNPWDCARCNNSVKPCDSQVTTPVRQYEGKAKGDSPFGVVDMAGNVWEWCLTDYANRTNDIYSNTEKRVLRGGSCVNNYAGGFRCASRGWFLPHDGGYVMGFRLALS